MRDVFLIRLSVNDPFLAFHFSCFCGHRQVESDMAGDIFMDAFKLYQLEQTDLLEVPAVYNDVSYLIKIINIDRADTSAIELLTFRKHWERLLANHTNEGRVEVREEVSAKVRSL